MRGWSLLFAFAALFNLAIGLALMIAPAMFADPAATTARELLPSRMLGWCIAVFGIGYAIVATAPARHIGLVQIGLIGKTGVVAITSVAFLNGVISFAQLAPALGDLPWVVAFAVFLSRHGVAR